MDAEPPSGPQERPHSVETVRLWDETPQRGAVQCACRTGRANGGRQQDSRIGGQCPLCWVGPLRRPHWGEGRCRGLRHLRPRTPFIKVTTSLAADWLGRLAKRPGGRIRCWQCLPRKLGAGRSISVQPCEIGFLGRAPGRGEHLRASISRRTCNPGELGHGRRHAADSLEAPSVKLKVIASCGD